MRHANSGTDPIVNAPRVGRTTLYTLLTPKPGWMADMGSEK